METIKRRVLMIDFSLKPCEWQKNMHILLQNVNLTSIEHLSDLSIVFRFSNTYDGGPCEKILCHTVWKFTEENCIGHDDESPFFICDVRTAKLEKAEIKSAFNYLNYGWDIPDCSDYNLLCMDSGEISINLLCKAIEVLANEESA
jgi:hypothetical protein